MEATKVLKKNKKALTPKLRFKDFIGTWNVDKLENKVNSISSGKIKPQEDGDFLVYGSTGVIGKSKEFSHEGDFLLVARVGANAGLINRVKGKYAVTDNTLVVDLKKEIAVPFCEAFLLKFNLNKLIFGSGQPLITGGLLKAIDFIFPALPEQQKIASFLSAIDEKIQQLTRKKELLELYKKGVMQQLFSGKLRFKDENGKSYPKWEEKRLGDIANITIGEFVIRTKQTPDGKYPVYNGGASWTGFYNDYNNEGNKIIISARGANAGFVNYEVRKYWAGNSCYSVDIIDKNLNIVLFIFYYIKFKQNLFTDYQQAANIPSVSKKDAQTFKIICPSSEEQQKIASYLSSINNKIESVATQIKQSQIFKKGLLQQMFV